MTPMVIRVANGCCTMRPSDPIKHLRMPREIGGMLMTRSQRPAPADRAGGRDDAAFAKHDAPRTDLIDEMHIVAGDDHRHADLVEALEQFHDLERELRIEIAGGLIGNEQRRLRHHRPRDADPLLLAGREFQGERFLLAEQADLIQRRPHAFVDFALRNAGDDQRQRHIVGHRPVMQQFVILKHHADLPAKLRDAARLDARGILIVDDHLAARGPFDECDQFQDAALARPRMAGQKGQRAAARY